MRTEILQAPDFGMLRVTFQDRHEEFVAESGAMVAHSAGVKIKTSLEGGLLAAAKRKVVGGESLFRNTFSASAPGQHVLLAPPQEGDLRKMKLRPGEYFHFVSGAYVAHTGEVKLDTAWQGARAILSGTGFFILKATGPGEIFFGAYGAIEEFDVGPDGLTVDNGQILGFGSDVNYELRKFGGYRSFFLGGEGVVCHFTGSGKVLVQTNNVAGLATLLSGYRSEKSN